MQIEPESRAPTEVELLQDQMNDVIASLHEEVKNAYKKMIPPNVSVENNVLVHQQVDDVIFHIWGRLYRFLDNPSEHPIHDFLCISINEEAKGSLAVGIYPRNKTVVIAGKSFQTDAIRDISLLHSIIDDITRYRDKLRVWTAQWSDESRGRGKEWMTRTEAEKSLLYVRR